MMSRKESCWEVTGSEDRTAMDPLDYFLWEEFIDPARTFECPTCGTLFGDESLESDEEEGCVTYQCPACGQCGSVEE